MLKRLAKNPLWLGMLALSPVGAPVPMLAAHYFGHCKGALGSGETCELGPFSGYIAQMTMWFEVG